MSRSRIPGRRRLLAGIAAIALATTALSACATAATDAAGSNHQATGDVKIGVILSTSGVYAGVGTPELQALKAYEKAQQPFHGRRLTFTFLNDQSNPSQAAALARQLAGDPNVMGIVGGCCAAIEQAVYTVATTSKVPWITLTPSAYPNFNHEPYAFSPNLGSTAKQPPFYFRIFEKMGLERNQLAVLANDDASGQSLGVPSQKYGNVVKYVPASVTDYTPILSQLRAGGAKAIEINQSATNAGQARRAQLSMGWNVPMIVGPQVLNNSLLHLIGAGADGLYVLTLASLLSDPAQIPAGWRSEAMAYRTAFQEQTGLDPSFDGTGAPNAWDAALSFGLAAGSLLDAGKSVTRVALQRVMDSQSYTGASGRVVRSSTDHVGFQDDSWVIAQIRNQKLVFVSAVR